MADGHPYKTVAYELGLSVSTVATHLARAIKKIGLNSRLQLLMMRTRSPRIVDNDTLRALSPVETAIAAWLVRGKTNRSIARMRGVSPHTVAKQVSMVLRKVGARSRYEAIALLTVSQTRQRLS